MFAENDGRLLLGGGLPLSYEGMLEEGSLVFTPSNRYTGEAIRNIADHSKGDFFYNFDPDKGERQFNMHNGPKDIIYNPDGTTDGKFEYMDNRGRKYTDGKSIYMVDEMLAEWFEAVDPEPERMRQGLPANDDATARMYLVFRGMNTVMNTAGWELDTPPLTIDQYVSFIGSRNPGAWTNPYSGLQMEVVPWHLPSKVINMVGAFNGESLADNFSYPENYDGDLSDFHGNYSYTVTENKIGEQEGHLLLYFTLPDGELTAFLAVGQTRTALERGFSWLGDMVPIGE